MCRKNGLERLRRCGWLTESERAPDAVVWARRGAQARECPQSLLRGESVAMVERFFVWNLDGCRMGMNMPAREAEAMLLLRQELEKEKRDDDRRGAN